MEITLGETLKKFFIKDKYYLIIILVLSFLIYPFIEKKVYNYKDLDYLLVRLNTNSPLFTYPETSDFALRYLEELQKLTDRGRPDRDLNISRIDCRLLEGPRKHDLDCFFFKKLNRENRDEIISKYIDYIREDYNYKLREKIDSYIKKESVRKDYYSENIDKGVEYLENYTHPIQRIFDITRNIKEYNILYEDEQKSPSISITHKLHFDQKNTIYNSILIFIMLCFINFCRIILTNN